MQELSYKLYRNGTHRASTPEDTYARIRGMFPAMGITRVANVTGLDNLGVPVAVCCRPNSRALSVSQGKGFTHSAAKVSAAMEAIETYHAERLFVPTHILSYQDLRETCNVADFDRLSRLKSGTATKSSRLPWVQGENLIDQCEIWVPFECVHSDYTMPLPHDHGNFPADSNGLASGNTHVEAINHAIYELIERDALALWALTAVSERKKRKVKLDTVTSPACRKLIERAHENGLALSVWDITSDLGIPTFLAKIMPVDREAQNRNPYSGNGTHVDPEIALIRAITEAAQSRLTFIMGSRDDKYEAVYKAIADSVYDKWYEEVILHEESIPFQATPVVENELLEDDQRFLLETLGKHGFSEVISVDLTRPSVNIPVVKIIIPGLEGISFPGQRLLGERGLAAFEKSGVGACRMK